MAKVLMIIEAELADDVVLQNGGPSKNGVSLREAVNKALRDSSLLVEDSGRLKRFQISGTKSGMAPLVAPGQSIPLEVILPAEGNGLIDATYEVEPITLSNSSGLHSLAAFPQSDTPFGA